VVGGQDDQLTDKMQSTNRSHLAKQKITKSLTGAQNFKQKIFTSLGTNDTYNGRLQIRGPKFNSSCLLLVSELAVVSGFSL